MNEEEKEVIEFLKHSLYEYEEIDTSVLEYIDKNHKIIYKLILKQQKEIKELKDKNKTLERLLQGNLYEMYKYYRELANSYQANCISKDKIKELIKEKAKTDTYNFTTIAVKDIEELLRG